MLRSENAAELADGGARCTPSRIVPERTRIQWKCMVGLKEHVILEHGVFKNDYIVMLVRLG